MFVSTGVVLGVVVSVVLATRVTGVVRVSGEELVVLVVVTVASVEVVSVGIDELTVVSGVDVLGVGEEGIGSGGEVSAGEGGVGAGGGVIKSCPPLSKPLVVVAPEVVDDEILITSLQEPGMAFNTPFSTSIQKGFLVWVS